MGAEWPCPSGPLLFQHLLLFISPLTIPVSSKPPLQPPGSPEQGSGGSLGSERGQDGVLLGASCFSLKNSAELHGGQAAKD